MAQLQAQLKRGILDELWESAPDSAGSLLDVIRSFKSARWDSIKTGTFVVNTSGGGYSVSFHVPEMFRQLGPDQFFMLGMEFVDIYNDAVSTLASNGNSSPSDDDIFAGMMADDRMQTVRGVMGDTTMLRYASQGPTR